MKLFPKLNLFSKFEMKFGVQKSILKLLLITLLLAFVIYGVTTYYNNSFKKTLENENFDSKKVQQQVEEAMEDAIEDTNAIMQLSLEKASEEVYYALEQQMENSDKNLDDTNKEK